MAIITSLTIYTIVTFCWFIYPLSRHETNLARISIILPITFYISYGFQGWLIAFNIDPLYGLVFPSKVPEVLNYLSLYLLFCLLGFYIGMFNNTFYKIIKNKLLYNLLLTNSRFNKKKWAIYLITFSVCFFILKLSTIDFDILSGTGVSRGYGQWGQQDLTDYLFIFSNLGTYIVIAVAAVCWAKSKKLVFVLPVIFESIFRLATLSRAFALPLFYFVLITYIFNSISKKMLFIVAIIVLLGIGAVYDVRGGADTIGLNVFFKFYSEGQLIDSDFLINTIISSSFLSKETLTFHVAPTERVLINNIFTLFRLLLPLPSFLGFFSREESNLVFLAGYRGMDWGIPMSFPGELYFRLGMLGSFCGCLVGIFLGTIERIVFKEPKVLGMQSILLYFSSIYFILKGFHSGVRASTRIFIYSIALLIIINILKHAKARMPFHR